MQALSSLTRRKFLSGTAVGLLAAATPIHPSLFAAESSRLLALDSVDKLRLKGCKAAVTDHLGLRALQLSDFPGSDATDSGMLAVIPEIVFKSGTIEVELAGGPMTGPTPGFLGLAIRIQDAMEKFEYVYLRPRNGRHETNFNAITPASTPPILDSGGRNSATSFPACMNRMSILKSMPGRK